MMTARYWVIVLLLVTAVVTLRQRGDVDQVPSSQPLNDLPTSIDRWAGRQVPLEAGVLGALGNGIFLNRVYTRVRASGVAADDSVSLFIGYYPSQRSGKAIHSPQICLPGAGWSFDARGTTLIANPHGAPYRVGEYLISNGGARQEVLYWYRSHGRSVANDYAAKLYEMADSVRSKRTDSALIRVITPVQFSEKPDAAHDRAVGFVEQLTPLLPAYLPD